MYVFTYRLFIKATLKMCNFAFTGREKKGLSLTWQLFREDILSNRLFTRISGGIHSLSQPSYISGARERERERDCSPITGWYLINTLLIRGAGSKGVDPWEMEFKLLLCQCGMQGMMAECIEEGQREWKHERDIMRPAEWCQWSQIPQHRTGHTWGVPILQAATHYGNMAD